MAKSPKTTATALTMNFFCIFILKKYLVFQPAPENQARKKNQITLLLQRELMKHLCLVEYSQAFCVRNFPAYRQVELLK